MPRPDRTDGVHGLAKLTARNASQSLRELAVFWGAVALLIFVVRSLLFGVFDTPTMRALLGLDDAELFGPVSGRTVQLEDPLLLALFVGAVLLAVKFAVKATQATRKGAA
jgi:hypothetical protein